MKAKKKEAGSTPQTTERKTIIGPFSLPSRDAFRSNLNRLDPVEINLNQWNLNLKKEKEKKG
jgi:hypothetical protein